VTAATVRLPVPLPPVTPIIMRSHGIRRVTEFYFDPGNSDLWINLELYPWWHDEGSLKFAVAPGHSLRWVACGKWNTISLNPDNIFKITAEPDFGPTPRTFSMMYFDDNNIPHQESATWIDGQLVMKKLVSPLSAQSNF
jgi:hypothetical protein